MRLGWNRDEGGVITVFAHATDGRGAAIADFWLQPLIDKLGMKRDAAKEWQQQFAELLVDSHNRHFTKAENDGGFAMQAPPSGLDTTPPDGAGVDSNHIKWLRECAAYFEKRPTDGEDMAHWANVSNAETARKIADEYERLAAIAKATA